MQPPWGVGDGATPAPQTPLAWALRVPSSSSWPLGPWPVRPEEGELAPGGPGSAFTEPALIHGFISGLRSFALEVSKCTSRRGLAAE